MELEFAQLTDAGGARDSNEDAVGCWPHDDGVLFAIADGVSGFDGGAVASALALATVRAEMARGPATGALAKRLWRAVQRANLAIYDRGAEEAELRWMRTTLTVTALVGGKLVAAHVGDCRLLRLRDGSFTQLTKDHNWAWQQVAFGMLSPDAARSHPDRHVLTRCLGQDPVVRIDLVTADLRPGDVLLQCSDGVHAVLRDGDIADAVQGWSPQRACQALVDLARSHGSDDNLSVQVAVVTACPQLTASRPRLLEKLPVRKLLQFVLPEPIRPT